MLRSAEMGSGQTAGEKTSDAIPCSLHIVRFRWEVAVCLALIGPVGADAAPQTTLKEAFHAADVVLVGVVREVTPLPRDEVFRTKPPVGALAGAEAGQFSADRGGAVYPCRYTLDVKYVIKGSPPPDTKELTVLWWVYWRDCKVPRGDWDSAVAKGNTLLWFLRVADSGLRALHDNFDAVMELRGFPSGTAERAERLNDPLLRLSYSLLAPGVRVPKRGYANAAIAGVERSVRELVGEVGWQTVMSQIYAEGDQEMRDEICVLLSSFGACLDCARRAASRGVGRGEYFNARYPFLDNQTFKNHEKQSLHDLGPYVDSLRKKRSAGEDLGQAKNLLVEYMCSSSPELRRRARSVLSELFDHSDNLIPCVPCEAR